MREAELGKLGKVVNDREVWWWVWGDGKAR